MTNARSLRIEKVPATTLVRIAWNGGGEVPDELKGHYTSPLAAKQAIAVWTSKAEREVEIDSPSEDAAVVKKPLGRPPMKSIAG